MRVEQGNIRFNLSRPQELNIRKEAEDKECVAPQTEPQELGAGERMSGWAEGVRKTWVVTGGPHEEGSIFKPNSALG